MKTVALVQARMGSRRLPGKVLLDISGQTMLARVVDRLRRAERIDETVIATTISDDDEPIVRESERLGAHVFRGSQSDVLDRFFQAAMQRSADVVVRVTADCPLIDPTHVTRAVDCFFSSPGLDYVGTGATYPEGYGVEVVSSQALEKAWREASLMSEREHVTPYIWNRPDSFSIKRLELPDDYSGFRVTVDREADIFVVRGVIEALAPSNPHFGIEEVIEFLTENPRFASRNAHIPRQAGYWKSVAEDDAEGWRNSEQ